METKELQHSYFYILWNETESYLMKIEQKELLTMH